MIERKIPNVTTMLIVVLPSEKPSWRMKRIPQQGQRSLSVKNDEKTCRAPHLGQRCARPLSTMRPGVGPFGVGPIGVGSVTSGMSHPPCMLSAWRSSVSGH